MEFALGFLAGTVTLLFIEIAIIIAVAYKLKKAECEAEKAEKADMR